MTTKLELVANVLEKTAAFLDAMEHDRAEEIRGNREKLAEFLREKYETITGDTIDDDVLGKIANSDVDVLAAFEQLASKTASDDDLGSPADRSDTSTPSTVKEAAEVAGEHFENWVMSE